MPLNGQANAVGRDSLKKRGEASAHCGCRSFDGVDKSQDRPAAAVL